jgi:hypothetical protein
MIIKVSSKNEYPFYPDIQGNLDKPEKDRFAIIVCRLNNTLQSGEWAHYGDGETKFDFAAKVKLHIVRIDNAPMLEIDGKKIEMTPDDLTSNKYPELFPIVNDLAGFIGDLESEETDGKK